MFCPPWTEKFNRRFDLNLNKKEQFIYLQVKLYENQRKIIKNSLKSFYLQTQVRQSIYLFISRYIMTYSTCFSYIKNFERIHTGFQINVICKLTLGKFPFAILLFLSFNAYHRCSPLAILKSGMDTLPNDSFKSVVNELSYTLRSSVDVTSYTLLEKYLKYIFTLVFTISNYLNQRPFHFHNKMPQTILQNANYRIFLIIMNSQYIIFIPCGLGALFFLCLHPFIVQFQCAVSIWLAN